MQKFQGDNEKLGGRTKSRPKLLKNSTANPVFFFYHKKKKEAEKMGKRNLLSENLKAYQKSQGLSLMELAEELDVPKLTLRAILKDGNTTLETVVRISGGMGMGLDRLVQDGQFPDKQFILKHLEDAGGWLASLPEEKRVKIAALIAEIWEVINE